MSPVQFRQSYAMTVSQLHRQLPQAGMDVKVSFQMSGAALSHECDPESCRCGMAILLVYGDDPQPATLWVRGQAGQVRLQRELVSSITSEGQGRSSR